MDQSVIVKTANLFKAATAGSGMRNNQIFRGTTYLLLCEEDVSVAQLKRENCHYHPNLDFSPAETINHFPSPPPLTVSASGGGQIEESRCPYRNSRQWGQCLVKCSWMCFLGEWGWSLKTRYSWRAKFYQVHWILWVVKGDRSSLHGSPTCQNSQSGRNWAITALRSAATRGLIYRHLNLSWKQ